MSSGRILYRVISKLSSAGILLVAAAVVLFKGEHFTDCDGPHVLPTLMCILFGLSAGMTAFVMLLNKEETQH